jgi:hypothetical protein
MMTEGLVAMNAFVILVTLLPLLIQLSEQLNQSYGEVHAYRLLYEEIERFVYTGDQSERTVDVNPFSFNVFWKDEITCCVRYSFKGEDVVERCVDANTK